MPIFTVRTIIFSDKNKLQYLKKTKRRGFPEEILHLL